MRKSKVLALGLSAGIIAASLGGCAPTEEGGGDAAGTLMFVVIMALFIAFFYFFMIRPQRKQRKEHEQLVASLKPGDKVITVGGIYGQIESLNEENVVLKVESGATLRIARNSIVVKRSK